MVDQPATGDGDDPRHRSIDRDAIPNRSHSRDEHLRRQILSQLAPTPTAPHEVSVYDRSGVFVERPERLGISQAHARNPHIHHLNSRSEPNKPVAYSKCAGIRPWTGLCGADSVSERLEDVLHEQDQMEFIGGRLFALRHEVKV